MIQQRQPDVPIGALLVLLVLVLVLVLVPPIMDEDAACCTEVARVAKACRLFVFC
jgi:hypothetical protein